MIFDFMGLVVRAVHVPCCNLKQDGPLDLPRIRRIMKRVDEALRPPASDSFRQAATDSKGLDAYSK